MIVSRWSLSFEYSFYGGKTVLNIVVTVLAKLVSLFFKSVYAFFLFLRAL